VAGRAGLDNLGMQAEDKAELNEMYARLHKADDSVIARRPAAMPSRRSRGSKTAGISWETFLPPVKARIAAMVAASAKRARQGVRCSSFNGADLAA
jgi:hypothetical protein